MRSSATIIRLISSGKNIPPINLTESFLRTEENSTVVVVYALLRFIESELFKGNRNTLSAFPQYLINAIFAGAITVAFIYL